MDAWKARMRDVLDNAEALDASVVDLVLAASELTEDETELCDHVARLLSSGRVRLQRVL